MRALGIDISVDGYFGTKDGIFKADFYTSFNITAASLLLVAASTAATKEVLENITEAEVAKVKVHVLATAATEWVATGKGVTANAAANSGMAELVVALAFGRVFKHFVGFVHFFELSFITALFVRVVLNSRLPEGFLEFVRAGVFAYS
jgi:hypothetical protein